MESLYGIITSSKEYGTQLKKKALSVSNTVPCNCQRSDISCLSVSDQQYKRWICSSPALVSLSGLLRRCGCSHKNLLLCFKQTFLLPSPWCPVPGAQLGHSPGDLLSPDSQDLGATVWPSEVSLQELISLLASCFPTGFQGFFPPLFIILANGFFGISVNPLHFREGQ